MNTAQSFKRTQEESLSDAVDRCILAMQTCHLLGVNEMHAHFHAQVDELLAQKAPYLTVAGYTTGDMLIWRPSAYQRETERER